MVYVYSRFQTKNSQELYTLCVLLLYGLYKGVPPPVLTTAAKKHNLKFRELHVGVACQTHEQGL